MREPGTPHPILQGAERNKYEDDAIKLLQDINFDKLFPSKNGKEHPQFTAAKDRTKSLLMSGLELEEIKERLLNGFIHNDRESMVSTEGINWDDKTKLLENLTSLFIKPEDKTFPEVLKEIIIRYNTVAGYIKPDNKKAQDELVKKIAVDVDRISKSIERRK